MKNTTVDPKIWQRPLFLANTSNTSENVKSKSLKKTVLSFLIKLISVPENASNNFHI